MARGSERPELCGNGDRDRAGAPDRTTGERRSREWVALISTVGLLVLVALGGAVPAAAAETVPKITLQPVSQTVEEGQAVAFTSTASGTPTPTVQWELSINGGLSWTPIEGANSTQLTIASASTTESGDRFRAVFKNGAGTATSKAATLTVRKLPEVTLQPVSTTVEEGQNAIFEATASGFPAPTIQWQTSANGGATWTNVSGATSNQLTITAAKTTLSGHQYRAVFTNTAGKATSQAATLTVQKLPQITKQPVGTTVAEGQSATFEASATGFPMPTVQWESSSDGGNSWGVLEGATSAQLTIASVQNSEDGREFRAVFSNGAGSATTSAATLTVRTPPVVTQQPSSAIVEVGEGALFEAMASGYPIPTTQWEVSTNAGATWSAIAGATSSQLTFENLQTSESGHEYRAVFTNTAGTATSNVATLTVATNRYSAVAWGANEFRQLGIGSLNAFSTVPIPVGGLTFVTSVAAGGGHSLALLADGTVAAWGYNGYGQLGDGTTTLREAPVPVKGLSGVKAISAGANHSLALLANGTVMAWGDNESGQLGNGSTLESEVPIQVKGLSGAKAVSAGANHSLALLANGTVMAWGDNESGQLGNGNTKRSTVPVAVKGLTGVTAVSAGGAFSLALLGKETVQAWGNDELGQLGSPPPEEGFRDTPVAVPTLSGVASIAAGNAHALALLNSGAVMAWGEDRAGQLGNGTIKVSETSPVAVTGLSGVSAISAGGQDSVALLASGSLTTWGANESGTLGDGASGSPSAVPVAVSGLAKVASVSAGALHMLAFGEPVPTVTGVSPKLGPLGGGTVVTITGASLGEASSVRFGSTPAASFTVNSSSSVTATAPAGTGTVDVTVTTPAGTSAASASDRFTYQPPPAIVKLLPKSGPVAGGTSVTITGTNLTGASEVSFGGTPATSFTVKSPTSITAVSPAATAGAIDVVVTTAGGTSAITTKDRFKYTPTVEAVSPNGGPTSGGTSVTVTGTGFSLASGATVFKFGIVKAKAVQCASSTSCTMIAPAHEAAIVDVTAIVNKATSPIAAPGDQFSYS